MQGQCGISNDFQHIVGGLDTKPGKHTYPVLLGRVDGDKIAYKCGGTLINRWYVLSAGHCHSKRKARWLTKANIGDWSLATDVDCIKNTEDCLPAPQVIDVEKIVVHEDYEYTPKKVINDIALYKLSRSVTPNEYLYFPCLPTPDTLNYLKINNFMDDIVDVHLAAVGWSFQTLADLQAQQATETLSTASSLFQQKVDRPVLGEASCQATWPQVSYANGQICAGGEPGKDDCGIGGGPLLLNKFDKEAKLLTPFLDGRWILIGITRERKLYK